MLRSAASFWRLTVLVVGKVGDALNIIVRTIFATSPSAASVLGRWILATARPLRRAPRFARRRGAKVLPPWRILARSSFARSGFAVRVRAPVPRGAEVF